ncbi:hypothetical protein [Pectobacterium polaris]|uniref:hypothetical protein n=1 Tax=Pectobacterium polaris TaxID=2042057 RepID=UPI0032E51573
MDITKNEVISAIQKSNDFKIVDDWKSEKSIMMKWNKRVFFISFDEKNDSDLDHEGEIAKMASADFQISAIFKPSDELSSSDIILHRYVIANKINIDVNFPSVVMYREPNDLYEVSVRHKFFFSKPNVLHRDAYVYIQGAVTSMLLSLMLTTKKLGDEFKKYIKEGNNYIKLARAEEGEDDEI